MIGGQSLAVVWTRLQSLHARRFLGGAGVTSEGCPVSSGDDENMLKGRCGGGGYTAL